MSTYYVKVKGEQGSRLVTKDKARSLKYVKDLKSNGIQCEIEVQSDPSVKNLKKLFRF